MGADLSLAVRMYLLAEAALLEATNLHKLTNGSTTTSPTPNLDFECARQMGNTEIYGKYHKNMGDNNGSRDQIS